MIIVIINTVIIAMCAVTQRRIIVYIIIYNGVGIKLRLLIHCRRKGNRHKSRPCESRRAYNVISVKTPNNFESAQDVYMNNTCRTLNYSGHAC